MQITLRQLEIFSAICREGNLTRAAARIGLSQAAASQAVAELENQLQRSLFDRRGRRLIQNAAGTELLPAAMEVLDRVRDLIRGPENPTFQIRMCASLTVGNYMLPPFIGRFARRHRDACLQLEVGNTEHVIASVRRFDSDAGWIEGVFRAADLRSFAWREDRLVIVSAPDHPLAGKNANATMLAAAAWVLREQGSGTRQVFAEAIAGKFAVENVRVELAGIGAVKRAVMAGFGLTCISRSAIDLELKARQLAVVRTPWLDLRRQITLLIHRQKYIDPGLRQFLRSCRIEL